MESRNIVKRKKSSDRGRVQVWSHHVHREFDRARTNPHVPRGQQVLKVGAQERRELVFVQVQPRSWTKVLLPFFCFSLFSSLIMCVLMLLICECDFMIDSFSAFLDSYSIYQL